MILETVDGNIADFDTEEVHVETAYVKSDDFAKRILRVTSDHGNDYGIRLADDSAPLENGAVFVLDEGHVLTLSAIADKVLRITAKDIDDMGRLAHFLGNLHKPVEIQDGQIIVLYDPVVDQQLEVMGADYVVDEVELTSALRHPDFSHMHHHEPEHMAHEHHHHHHHHDDDDECGHHHHRHEHEGHHHE
jgi:urease accessory protein